ncbi:MAG: methionine--tRNA ligase [Pseudobacteriovorax sp.]|nr:methionine--tRNA ligase [Pseudobacteriovorax sp.]
MKKKLITSALPYVNNIPHLGNIIGCVLSGDVYARFCRMRGYETLYICGTDGYGTATETKAREEGLTPREICEKYHVYHDEVYKHFNISFDAFGKTFDEGHTDVVQGMFEDLQSHNQLEEQTTSQTFCKSCDTFLADRFVTGVCPKCGYDKAQGDQCESCGTMLNPSELKSPQCALCDDVPELRDTHHLYLNLPEISDSLENWQKDSIEKGKWTNNAKTTTNSWMHQGLNPRPITRDLKWGVDVPKEGYESKVFYVWFDAPLGYVSITKSFFPDTWKDWWFDPENVELYQFIGKDNIPFHSIIFPACQIGSGKEWTKVHQINSTEYLNYENDKFSKSKGTGIFGNQVKELDLPIDFWRFYLLGNRPEKQDANFSWQEFFDKVNNDLIDNIGNLINRVLVYTTKNFPAPLREPTLDDPALKAFKEENLKINERLTELMELGQIRESVKCVLALGKLGNAFFHEQEPWKKIKEDRDHVERVLFLLVNLVRDIGIGLRPFVPETADKILAMVGVDNPTWKDLGNDKQLIGTELTKPSILFEKLDVTQVDRLKAKFAGEATGFEVLDVRIGQVKEVKDHPKAAHLYVLQVDIGESKARTVVSALKKHYTPEDLTDKKVVVLSNLEAADFSGVASEGMLLAAETRKKLELLSSNQPIGSQLYREGYESKDKKQISFDEFKGIKLEVKEHRLLFEGQPILAGGSEIATENLKAGKVK